MAAVIHSVPVERLRVVTNEVLVRLRGEDTGGELSVVEFTLPAGSVGAAPHIHHGHAEEFIIIDGEVTFDLVDDGRTEVAVVGGGGTVTVPIGIGHGFRNTSAASAKLIGLFRPSGYERYFREVHEMVMSGHMPTPEDLAVLRAKYNTISI
jgi:quercetin dioxygenase-like cupin family protein